MTENVMVSSYKVDDAKHVIADLTVVERQCVSRNQLARFRCEHASRIWARRPWQHRNSHSRQLNGRIASL